MVHRADRSVRDGRPGHAGGGGGRVDGVYSGEGDRAVGVAEVDCGWMKILVPFS